MSTLQRSLDKAVRAENRRAVRDRMYEARTAFNSITDHDVLTPKYPAGTPEYEAYATELRAELAKWVAGVGEYSQEPTKTDDKTGD